MHAMQIQEALRLWDGTGTFLFTSSAGVFAVDDGTLCTEDSPVKAAGTSERTARCKTYTYRGIWPCHD